MTITSPAFEHSLTIPTRCTCDGANVNPPLTFSGVPSQTRSLTLIIDDPDAPGGTWIHWMLWNIPADVSSIAEGSVPRGAIQGKTSFEEVSYGGPCPPRNGEHRYFFRLFALDTELDLPEGSMIQDVTRAMEEHVLKKTELMGTYQRPKLG